MKKHSILFMSLLLTFCLASCTKKEQKKFADADKQLIAAHTSGVISRMSSVRVLFAMDVADSSQLNKPVKPNPFSFKPKLKGTTVWSDPRTLEFQPDERLPQDQTYQVQFDIHRFVETSEKSFEFSFSTISQSIDITTSGLQIIDKKDLTKQRLDGTLVTADFEYGHNVENVLSATQEKKDLNITWQHSSDGRVHSFSIEPVTRSKQPSQVKLKWDGNTIDVDDKGERIYDVPSLAVFKIVDVKPVQGQNQCIEAQFSDPLNTRQNLQGLIRVQDHNDLRFTIDGNRIRIYSHQQFKDKVTVEITSVVQNTMGTRLEEPRTFDLFFQELKPQVKFSDKGVIIPTTQGLTIPIEAVNLNAVIVKAEQIFGQNVHQFLQRNSLNGEYELNRVGRTVWKKTVQLDITPDKVNQWNRFGLDVTSLLENHPGGFYRLTLSFKRRHIIYDCPDLPAEDDELTEQEESEDDWEQSYWDYYDPHFNWREYYDNRFNPCHAGYYHPFYDHNITESKNIIISDLGLMAKRGQSDSLFVVVTNIKTTDPIANADIKVYDFQKNVIAQGKTNSEGQAFLKTARKPFLLQAESGKQKGFLKLDEGSSLSISHFDVGGMSVQKNIKGFIYGERGVWRPGDPIHLSFILFDLQNRLPSNYPIQLEFSNPQGQVIDRITQQSSLNGFYTFTLKTLADAPTGNWQVKVKAGGAEFEKTLKIETIMPNRLTMDLDLNNGQTVLKQGPVQAKLTATWLHGAKAQNLKTDVQLEFKPIKTEFNNFKDFVFDDPVRTFEPESKTIYEGKLNQDGRTNFDFKLKADNVSPGMMKARFTTRVFEPGGAFSTEYQTIPFHPFNRYIGISTPKGDQARGMLLTDTTHTVQIVAVDTDGKLVPNTKVKIELYKINWRWWWEKGSERLADYIGRESYQPIKTDEITLKNGKANWPLKINHPAWGRFLVRVYDEQGKHITGKIMYIDWPGWAGRGRKMSPEGATVLAFASDKTEYNVGDKVRITIPTPFSGRGLLSIEKGSQILSADWFEGDSTGVQYEFTAAPGMAPNVFVNVTYLQPHLNTQNDLPIRMYGVIPVKINDPKTQIQPLIECNDVFKPESQVEIKVSEQDKTPMTYTLAVVDEGLLNITRFKTPDPWSHFYQREALGVKTWDLYDLVAGAYGGTLEKLLAIGGDGEISMDGQQRTNRFPPMVRFYGPFEYTGKQQKHTVDIPQYVGSVRVMVVAGHKKAFGHAEKSVFVRKPLMLLATLPRVLSSGEETALPVSVFCMEDDIKDVTVNIKTKGTLEAKGSTSKSISFTATGDKLVTFNVAAGSTPGTGEVSIEAVSGSEKARQTIQMDVRIPVNRVTQVVDKALEPGNKWDKNIKLPGLPGTNNVILEISQIPPLNLGKRLNFLIQYPHGCVEQTTSAVFPQLYLNSFIKLSKDQKQDVENNIKNGIARLSGFQNADGGFGYWPGNYYSHEWCTNYAGHFLIEAEKAGYNVPQEMINQLKRYQRNKAQAWVTGGENSDLIQAYRLYTLALAEAPELGTMNRLKESDKLSAAAKWRLAAAYQLAGQPEAAASLMQKKVSIPPYQELSNTFGSDLRDKAMILEALCLTDQKEQAITLAQDIAGELAKDRWYSTQTTAYALIALAHHVNLSANNDQKMKFEYTWNNEKVSQQTEFPVFQQDLEINSDTTAVINVKNNSDKIIYARLLLEGLPRVGQEQPMSNGLKLTVKYINPYGNPLDITQLAQGTDFIAIVKVKNTGVRGTLKEVALTHLVPSGCEIHNARIADNTVKNKLFDYQDIRDDRIYTYFDIKQNEEKIFRVLLNAAYTGKYYVPPVYVETMYDATINAQVPGQWMTITRPD